MLELAFKYEEKLRELFTDTWYDEKYKFYHASRFHTRYACPKPGDGDWNEKHFVSLDKDKNILGFIGYNIDRCDDMISDLYIINFTDNKVIFGRDLQQILDDIFCKFNYRKLEFSVVCGNPIEKSYEKLIHKYGGNIVGVRRKHCLLMDNQFYDDKLYEIFREDYINNKGETKHE